MKVATLLRSPPWRAANPYPNLLEVGLKRNSIETVDDPGVGLSWHWLLRHHRAVDAVHFHWLQYDCDRGTAAQGAGVLSIMARTFLPILRQCRISEGDCHVTP